MITPARPRRADLLFLAAFTLLAAAFLVPRYLGAGTLYFSTPHEQSGVGLHVPYQVANRLLWSEGVPLWNPWSGCGTPHLANLQSAVFFPLNWLFLVLPPVPAAELLLVLRVLLCGVTSFVFGRTLGVSRGASFFLAIAFALNSWELRLANHHNVSGDLLLPLTASIWFRLGETGRRGLFLWASALTAAHVLVGMPESAVFSLAFAGLMYAYAAFLGRGRRAWGGAARKVTVLAAVLGLGALLAAVQVLPFLEYLRVAWSTHLGAVDFTERATSRELLVATAFPFLDPNASVLWTSLSVGSVVIAFALRGLARPLHGGVNVLLGLVALAGTLKLFGFFPLHALSRLPVIDMLNFPLYLPPLLGLALATLAAMGVDEWWQGSGAGGRALLCWLLFPIVVVLLWIPGRGAESAWEVGPYALALLGIAALAVAVGLARGRLGPRRFAPLLALPVLLLSLELWLHSSRVPVATESFESVYRDPLKGRSAVGAFVAGWLGDERRFTVAGRRLANVAPLWGPALGFDYLDAIHVARYWTYKDASDGFWRRDALDRAGAGDRLMDLAAVGAVVTLETDEPGRTIDLMRAVRDKGPLHWEGAGTGEFVPYDRYSAGDGLALVSNAPFHGTLRRMQLAGFEEVRFRYGVVTPAGAGAVRFELGLQTRSGEATLFTAESVAGATAWREAKALLPVGTQRGALTVRVSTAPDAPATTAGFGNLRLVRTGHLDETTLEPRFSAPPYEVYENTRALPRAYVAREARVVDRGEVIEELFAPGFVPGRTVVLEQPPPLDLPGPAASPSAVRLVESRARRVALEVDGTENGLLVLNDTFYPGWTARVDGVEREILPANLMFRAVAVEPGRHTVEFTYDPWSFRAGALLSLATLAGLVGAALSARTGRSPA